ncbi:hypothetical protein BJ742DRAFT_766741 [Cladochytrium replicatum]|nr:hypothetical protein BJ742DRAFT_766741 [Cladochytrium replicatum]
MEEDEHRDVDVDVGEWGELLRESTAQNINANIGLRYRRQHTDPDGTHHVFSATEGPAEAVEPTPEPSGSSSDPPQGGEGGPSTDPASDGFTREEKTCRICYGGVDEEEALGRLFSPCKCKGTMKYVHLGCLNEWRKVSRKKESFFQCDYCHYKYHFRRTTIARAIMNEVFITLLALVVFAVLVLVSGYLMKLALLFGFPEEFETELNLDEADEFDLIWMLVSPRKPWYRLELLPSLLRGLVVVGSLGGLHLIGSTALTGPVGIFGRWGFNVGARGNNRNVDSGWLILILVFLVFGVFRAMAAVYGFCRNWTRKSLSSFEMYVLDTGS